MQHDKEVQNRVRQHSPPGVIFAHIRPGSTQYNAYGSIAEIQSSHQSQPPDINTAFEIGSNTKVFMALLFARFEELDLLSLTEPLNSYLPQGCKAPSRHGRQVRLINLLSHTAALPRMPPNLDLSDMHAPLAYTSGDLLNDLPQLSLQWDIGAAYVYSNFAYMLLGYVAEQLTGKTCAELLKSHIFDPLGLQRTQFAMPQNNAAISHYRQIAIPHTEFGVLAAAGGLTSCAADMATFLAANLAVNPPANIPANAGAGVTELHSAMQRTHILRYRESTLFALACGWHMQHRNGQEILWHRGETAGQTSFMAINLKDKAAVMMLSNAAAGPCCSELALAQLDQAIAPAPLPTPALTRLTPQQLNRFAGRYSFDAAIDLQFTPDRGYLQVAVTGQASGTLYAQTGHDNCLQSEDGRVTVHFAADRSSLVIREHGIDRIAYRIDRTVNI